ncbi:MAG: phytanoyl-CoA dioxygenase family protein [Spirochaetaceae bacterium]|nr:phytanoyl-CoA dioxygenase family protein [Spirochaetaceae bacterium]MDE0228109.1 phytanoyl-CoA dioxygenase family protein [Spirochaetaceae bacterium]
MTMEQCLADLGSSAELLSDRQRGELRRKGYTLLPGVIDADWLAALRERFEELVAAEGAVAGLEVHQEKGARRLADLVNKGDVFDGVWSHPLLLAAVHCVIDAPFHLGSLNARDATPGNGLQALHQDGRRDVPPPRYGCNSVWMLDDFTAENGCTRMVPGTCTFAQPREVLDDPKAPHPDEELITGPAGSVAVFNSYTWHGGTLNRTPDAHRRCLHCYFNPRHLAQQTDQRAYLRPETAARLSPAQRYLLDLEDA